MSESITRVIKRYANRKLYDTRESRYVTLEQISEMIRRGEDVKVVDNNSKEDLTSVTLAQIIFEEEKKQKSFLPLSALRNIIQSGGQSLSGLMSQLSESAGRVFRHDSTERKEAVSVTVEKTEKTEKTEKPDRSEKTEKNEPTKIVRDFMDGVQSAIDDWQKRLDTNIHHALDSVSPLAPLQKEIQTLGERIAELEKKLGSVEAESTPSRADDQPAGR
jgi:polyhydroxyalkanoate synthesis repressor PhaR